MRLRPLREKKKEKEEEGDTGSRKGRKRKNEEHCCVSFNIQRTRVYSLSHIHTHT